MHLSEVLGALSYALDLTEGQPAGHAVRCCLIGTRLGEELGLDPDTLSNLHYALLLKDAGCSANASETADLFASDDHEVKRNLKTVDWTRWLPAALYSFRNAARGQGLLRKIWQTIRIGTAGKGSSERLVRIRCERGAEIARKLGFPEETASAIQHLDEHWDGEGNPDGTAGDDIPLLSRIALLAQTLDVFVVESDHREALRVAGERAGSWFDPELAEVVLRWRDEAWWDTVYGEGARALLADAEPDERTLSVGPDGLDRVAEGFAEIVDAKSPFTYRHSAEVARWAVALGRSLGLEGGELRALNRAALLHDIGKLAVSNRILDKAGGLTDEEFRVTRRHPIHSWTILSQVDAFSGIAGMASLHHERLDGGGYPWGFDADRLDRPARIIAVADVFEALTADRPYRGPMDPEDALDIIRSEAGTALDGSVVEALEGLVASDGPPPRDDDGPTPGVTG